MSPGWPHPMETLQHALERLQRAGYRVALEATDAGFRERDGGGLHAPEDLVISEIVRFEGVSDPDDEAVLFALRAREGALRATFVSSFGPNTEPVAAELMRRLGDGRAERAQPLPRSRERM